TRLTTTISSAGRQQTVVQTGQWQVRNNRLVLTLTRIEGQPISYAQVFTLRGNDLTPISPRTPTTVYTRGVAPAGSGLVTGTISYNVRRTLSPNAVVTVQLLQLTGATSTQIAEQRITNPGQVPIRFAIQYNPRQINANRNYVIQAQIYENNRLAFDTTRTYYVITNGNPVSNINVLVEPVGTTPGPTTGTLRGTITYVQRHTLSPDAVVRVQLVDVTGTGPVTVVSEQTIRQPGQVPIAFTLTFDPNEINTTHSYAVQARIVENGRTTFITSRPYLVLTQGRPTTGIDIVVDPVGD
ncbi:MAG TPA: YbaY family lipoprotein, partial [Armatimonadota bacterium]|nr:YbaY family lipoprotein [Armatimonadota bacterium]